MAHCACGGTSSVCSTADRSCFPTSPAYTWRVGRAPPSKHPVYNLAQQDTVTLRDLVSRIARIAGATPRFVDATWEEIAAAGLDPSFSPLGGRWSSVPDPSRAAEWGFQASRLDDYLPGVVRWYLEHRPEDSHPGYAERGKEIEMARRLLAAASGA